MPIPKKTDGPPNRTEPYIRLGKRHMYLVIFNFRKVLLFRNTTMMGKYLGVTPHSCDKIFRKNNVKILAGAIFVKFSYSDVRFIVTKKYPDEFLRKALSKVKSRRYKNNARNLWGDDWKAFKKENKPPKKRKKQ